MRLTCINDAGAGWNLMERAFCFSWALMAFVDRARTHDVI